MKCKFCFAELEDDVTVCPVCSKNLEEPVEESTEVLAEEAIEVSAEPAGKKSNVWKIVLAAVAGVVLLAVLVLAVLYGSGVKLKNISAFFGFAEAEIDYKSNYTVSDKKVEEKKDVVIAKVGNQTLTNGQLQIYYWMNVRNFVDSYGYYLETFGLDISKPLDKQVEKTTGLTFQQYFLGVALQEWCNYATIVQKAEQEDYVLDGELQAYLDTFEKELNDLAAQAGHADAEALIDASVSAGSSMKAYYDYVRTGIIGDGYRLSQFEAMNPTQEEMETYYTANEEALKGKGYGKEKGDYYNVRHILVEIEGEGTKDENGKTVYTEAQWEACRAKAQKMLDDFLAGDATETAFAELAKKESADPGSASNGGLYEMLTKDYGFIKDFENWYLEEGRKPGDTGLVKNTESSVQGYHIMYFSENTPIWEYWVRTLILNEKENKMLEEAKTQWPMEVNYKKIVLGNADLTQS